MGKTTSILIHTEPELKKEVDEILNQLGITMSGAINLYLKQIVLQKGIPLTIKLPESPLPNFYELTEEELDERLLEAENQIKNGQTYTLEEVREEFERDFGVCLGKSNSQKKPKKV